LESTINVGSTVSVIARLRREPVTTIWSVSAGLELIWRGTAPETGGALGSKLPDALGCA